MAGFVNKKNDTLNAIDTKVGFVSKILKTLSRLGMRFDDEVVKQSKAMGIKEKPLAGFPSAAPSEEDIWNAFASVTMSDSTLRDSVAFFDKDYGTKRDELRNFALNDEIEEIIDVLTDEIIVYDQNNMVCDISYNGDLKEDLKNELSTIFKKVYYYFGFSDGHTFWDYFRKWLVDGFLSFEIIYDKDQKHIIGFKELDPATLKPTIIKDENDNSRKIFIQYEKTTEMGKTGRERTLLDSQVIYISFSHMLNKSRVSYVERLVRSFNLLRIMEHTRIIWAVTNSSYKMKFVIPVGGKSKTRAKQSLTQLIQNYKEDIDFNYDSGELKVNGKPFMQFNKEYWLPSKDGESPDIEVMGGDGPDISDVDALKYFVNKLRDASKIPYNRFDAESPSGYELAAEGMMRDEIRFSKFVNRLRSKFKEIIIKPVYNQMIINHPELVNDENFKVNLGLQFHKENVFEEMKEYELTQKRIDLISALKDGVTKQDKDLNEIPYFNIDFLIDKVLVNKFMQITKEDIDTNEKYVAVATLEKEGYKREDAIKIVFEGKSKKSFKKAGGKKKKSDADLEEGSDDTTATDDTSTDDSLNV